MDMLNHASIFALLTLGIQFIPLVVAAAYLVRVKEHYLALMRPTSLAGIFAAIAGTSLGFVNILHGIGATGRFSPESYRLIALGAAEALVPAFFGFACLSVAWLLVAVGLSRERRAP